MSDRHNPTSAEVLERATANWKRCELGLDPAPFPESRNDFINEAFRQLTEEAKK